MLDICLVRENPALVKANEKKRNRDPKTVDEVLALDEKWKKELKFAEELKHKRNVVSQEINELKKAGKNGASKIKEMRKVVEEIKNKEEKAEKFLEERNDKLKLLSNIMHEKVPKGKDASDNVEIKKGGKIPKFNFPVKGHVELLESLGLVDFNASARVSGNGFYYLKKEIALLNQALIRFAIDFMTKKGYDYVEPPLMLHEKEVFASMDKAAIQQSVYSIKDEDLNLIGTSEQSVLAMHSGKTIPDSELPKKYVAYSMCFRKEVGAHGINDKGLWRTHQFNKVEQFVFCRPEDSEQMYTELFNNSDEILKELELPYRWVEICTGDLADWKHRSADFETWRPTTNEYGELGSLSNCTDYQARKLNIKVVGKDGSRKVVHTLNNTALATSRIMVAILENFQTKQGTIKIPKALWPYMNGITEIGKK
ncbi:MAG: serine--tRNA ligase [Nanoarchaeota archaeon]